MIELRHLRYFLETARQHHVTRAAAALHVTQSTLSHQVRQLEERLGVTLFDRLGRGVRLTEAGETFMAFATRAVLEVEEGKIALEELQSLVRGRLRIGVIHTYNATVLPPVIAQFGMQYPGVHIVVDDLPASVIERDVANGDLDLGIAFSPATHETVVTEPLFSERLVLVVRRDHPFARLRGVPAERLSELDLAVQTARFSSRTLIDQRLGNRIRKRIRMEMSSIDAMLHTIRLRGMAAIVFERAVKKDESLVCIPIVRPKVARTAALLWHAGRTRSAAATKMAKAIRVYCAGNSG